VQRDNLTTHHLYTNGTGKLKVRCQLRSIEEQPAELWEFELDDANDTTNSSSAQILRVANQDATAMHTHTHADTLDLLVPPLWVLYALKRAHIYWNVHWLKSIEDIHFIQRFFPSAEYALDAAASRTLLLHTRRHETQARLGESSQANLAMSNDAFFEQSAAQVLRLLPHDDLHLAVAYGARPLFESFKHDLSRATFDLVGGTCAARACIECVASLLAS
jgi:hypothetical protein